MRYGALYKQQRVAVGVDEQQFHPIQGSCCGRRRTVNARGGDARIQRAGLAFGMKAPALFPAPRHIHKSGAFPQSLSAVIFAVGRGDLRHANAQLFAEFQRPLRLTGVQIYACER